MSGSAVPRSRTNDPSRNSIKFSKVTPASYDVDVITKGANGHYPVVAPPRAAPIPTSSSLRRRGPLATETPVLHYLGEYCSDAADNVTLKGLRVGWGIRIMGDADLTP
jgi:hypothetical protein